LACLEAALDFRPEDDDATLKDDVADRLMNKESREAVGRTLEHRLETEDIGNCTTKMLPKVLMLGLNHGGSSTLGRVLQQHPNLSHGFRAEHKFFASAGGSYYRPKSVTSSWQSLSVRSVSDYLDEFEVSRDTLVTFDESPFYWSIGCPHLEQRQTFRREPGRKAVEEVRDILGGNVKLIFAIKDPVLWLTSVNCLSDDASHCESDDAKEAIFCMPDALQNWVDVFGRDQIMFLDSAKMFINLSATADTLYEFIGVPPWKCDDTSAIGRRRQSNPATTSQKNKLIADPRYTVCKERMERISGLDLEWSSIT
jgi:hypothetical protein